MKTFRSFNEQSVDSIDQKIDAQIDRHKNIKGKEPRHNKTKERVRDGIERLRNQRNRLTGNPKSEPVESVQEARMSPIDKINKLLKQKADREARSRKLYQDREARLKKEKESKNEAKAAFDLDNLTPTKYPSLDNEFSKRKAKKKRVDEDTDLESLDEILNVAQRRKRSIIARRNKAKLKRGRQRASRRIADKDRIANRARRQAKSDLVKKLTKGVSKANLSPQRKAEIERRLKKMDARVARNQKKLLPTVRKRDRGL